MKKVFAFLGITSALILGFNIQVNASKDTTKQKVIIVFKDKQAQDKNLILNSNGEVGKEFKNIPAMSAELTQTAINSLKQNPDVVSVEYNKQVRLLDSDKSVSHKTVNINGQTEDWGIKSVKARESWDKGITGKGVKVAVLDTGVEYYHPDLTIAGGISFVKEKKEDGTIDSSYDDYNGHGTHVSGIIGAKNNNVGTIGVAPDSQLYAVKILDSGGIGTLENVIAGIDWSITNNMNIVNLSIGSVEGSNAYHAIFQKAKDKGIIIVAASGNDNLEDASGVDYPAKYSEVMGVSAVDKYLKHANFSSMGPEVDIAAPGVSILSTYIDGKYEYMSGTSMATPYTSGVLALYKSAYPSETSEGIVNMLYANVIDLETLGKDNKTGRGLVQAPTTKEEAPIVFDKKITIFEKSYLYNYPNDRYKTSNMVNPQVLQALEKQNGYILVKTWLGNKYIKSNLYLEGEKIKASKKIQLSEITNLYDLPFDSYKRKELVNPQTVYSVEEINGWYLIETWLGYKYIKPENAIISNYIEKIKLSYNTDLLTQADSKYKTGAVLYPQTVTATSKKGSYFLINTWLGERWIEPKYPIIGEIETLTDKIVLNKKVDLYDVPYTTIKTVASLSANQTVQATERWNNWVLIKTWLGDKWIQL